MTVGVLARAVVDGRCLRYRRAGRGPAVLLVPAPSGARADPALIDALARHFRVLVPLDGTTDGSPVAAGRALLAGLGIEQAHLVADAAVAADALWLAHTEPELITALVLVGEGATDVLDPIDAGAPPGRFPPLLLVRRPAGVAGGTPCAGAAAIVAFLQCVPLAAAGGCADFR